MSTKPSSVPTWDSNLANVSALTGGHALNGFLANAKPTSGELNTLFNMYGSWCQYLNDGNFTGAAAFASTLAVTGAVTMSSTLAVTGAISGAGLTNAVNTHVVVSGTGLYKHGLQTMVVPLIGAYAGATAPSNTISLAGANFEVVWFQLPVGKRVLAVRAGIIDSVTGPTKLQVGLYTLAVPSMAGSPGTLSAASSGAGTQQTITSTGLTTVLAAGNIYGVYIGHSTGTATCSINNVEIDYDQP